ncbi:MAG: hypothetical protein ACYSWX_01050 [Planctomycetota bacterium]|jgi:hypothetical protein
MERDSERGPSFSAAPIFLVALKRAAIRPAAWFTGAAGVAAMAALTALPTAEFFQSVVPGAYDVDQQVHSLDAAFRHDQRAGLGALWDSIGSAGGWLAMLAFLFGVYTAGGWLGTLLDGTRSSSVRRYFHGGVRYFWRFLRLAIFFLILLDVAGRVLLGDIWKDVVLEGWAGWPGGDSEFATSELTVRRLTWLQHGLHAAVFALLFVWATYARVRIVLQNQSSVVIASIRTFWLLLRHPIQTLRPLALLFTVDFAVLIGLGLVVGLWLQPSLEEHPSVWRVNALWVISLFVLLVRELFDGARYAAALAVSERLIRPLRSDPWKDRVGAPGGPQYPVSDDDEFSISM